jgi:hypothetical protein
MPQPAARACGESRSFEKNAFFSKPDPVTLLIFAESRSTFSAGYNFQADIELTIDRQG